MTLARERPLECIDETSKPSVAEALDALRVAITVFDASERLTYANRHYKYLFRGLPECETLLGRSYDDLVRLEIAGGDVTERQVLADQEQYVAFRRAQLLSGDFSPRDVKLSDGRIVEIKVRRTAEKGWIALWTDVTQARQNLDRLNNAIALSADAFAFYDRGDKLILCNDEYAALYSLETPDELVGCMFETAAERLAKTIAREEQDGWLKRRLEIHRLPAGVMTLELANGTTYVLRDRATADGGRAVVFTDVTEHHRAERALAEQTRALDATRKALARSKAETIRQAGYLADLAIKLDQTTAEADSTKRTLLRTMSHELKTPLNAIIGFSDLLSTLAEHASPEQVREYSGLIHQGGKNLLKLINQILDLTKISAGRYELHRQTMDSCLGIWLAKDTHEGRAEEKNIVIEADAATKGLMVEVDENAYGAMVSHLVENAVNFTQPGGHVRLRTERADGRVRITVTDDGPGVAPEDIDRILEPFEQGGRAPAEHNGGAGLGLTLVKALAELHGGTLSVQSTPGQGFTATIELPAAA